MGKRPLVTFEQPQKTCSHVFKLNIPEEDRYARRGAQYISLRIFRKSWEVFQTGFTKSLETTVATHINISEVSQFFYNNDLYQMISTTNNCCFFNYFSTDRWWTTFCIHRKIVSTGASLEIAVSTLLFNLESICSEVFWGDHNKRILESSRCCFAQFAQMFSWVQFLTLIIVYNITNSILTGYYIGRENTFKYLHKVWK